MALQRLNILRNLQICQQRFFSLSATKSKSLLNWYRELWTPKPTNLPPYAHFTQVGDPVLRSAAASVPEDLLKSSEVNLIVEQMVKVLRRYNCVGIAAPQIGVSLRIIVMEFHERKKEEFSPAVYKARKMSTLPLTVVINPAMKITGYEKHKHPEGCMSVRGYSAEVERYDCVTLTGFDRTGNATELDLSGWNARIAQHEMDHLDGKLYIDHMDHTTFTCTCWEAVNAKSGRVEIPFYK